jgi:futalosine hydrolase
MSLLVVHATHTESVGVESLRCEVLTLGVGKTAAAAALTERLVVGDAHRTRPSAVLLIGLCGAYAADLAVGSLCLVANDVLADEGRADDRGFHDIASLGFGSIGPFATEPRRTARVAAALRAPIVAGATVSTCSGTDALSAALAARTGAAIETMEGAAVGLVCARFAVPWIQLRAVSNRTGAAYRATFDARAALDALRGAAPRAIA